MNITIFYSLKWLLLPAIGLLEIILVSLYTSCKLITLAWGHPTSKRTCTLSLHFPLHCTYEELRKILTISIQCTLLYFLQWTALKHALVSISQSEHQKCLFKLIMLVWIDDVVKKMTVVGLIIHCVECWCWLMSFDSKGYGKGRSVTLPKKSSPCDRRYPRCLEDSYDVL